MYAISIVRACVHCGWGARERVAAEVRAVPCNLWFINRVVCSVCSVASLKCTIAHMFTVRENSHAIRLRCDAMRARTPLPHVYAPPDIRW